MKLVIRDFKATLGHRDVNHHENLQGMTGLKNPMWGGHLAAARKRSHQWCVTLTPNNAKTIGRMTCHCFLRPISYTTVSLVSSTILCAIKELY